MQCVCSALQATGRKKVLLAGIVTDVCVVFPALSLLANGYEVYIVVDASGTFNNAVRDAALTRASEAGAVLINWFAVACELQRDWRSGPGNGQVSSMRTSCAGETAAFVPSLPVVELLVCCGV